MNWQQFDYSAYAQQAYRAQAKNNPFAQFFNQQQQAPRQVPTLREKCEPVCRKAAKVGIGLRSEKIERHDACTFRFTWRLPSGKTIAGEERSDVCDALAAACEKLEQQVAF